MLIIGPEGCCKRSITDRILRTYETPDNAQQIVIARMKGLACTNDRDALTSVARQLGMLTASDNVNISIEALQARFQVRISLLPPFYNTIRECDSCDDWGADVPSLAILCSSFLLFGVP